MPLCKDSAGRVTVVVGATCPPGTTQQNTGVTGGQAGGTSQQQSGGSASIPGSNLPPDKDTIVYTQRLPGTAPDYQTGSGVDYLNSWQTKTQAAASITGLPVDDQMLLLSIARSRGGRSMNPVWEMFIEQAAAYGASGKRVTPMELARKYAQQYGITATSTSGAGPSGGGSSGSGAQAPTPADATSIKRMMDSLSLDKIGRTLSDQEFQRYYGSYVRAFRGNPELDPNQHGVNALQANDDYQEYQVATKFASAFDKVLRGAS